jgi:hypothetical protein
MGGESAGVPASQELSCFLFNPYAIRCPSLAYYLGHFRVVGAGLSVWQGLLSAVVIIHQPNCISS